MTIVMEKSQLPPSLADTPSMVVSPISTTKVMAVGPNYAPYVYMVDLASKTYRTLANYTAEDVRSPVSLLRARYVHQHRLASIL